MMLPFQTARRAALQDAAEGEVGGRVRRRVLLGGVEVDVLAAVGGVGAGDARLGALAGEPGLHPHVAARRAEAERDPVERAVAPDLGALGAEDPAALGELLTADVAQARVVADDQLGDDVEDAVELVGAGQELLPDLGLGALLEHDQRAPVDQRAGRGLDARSARSAARRRRRAARRRTRRCASRRRCARRTGRRRRTTEPSGARQLGVLGAPRRASATITPSGSARRGSQLATAARGAAVERRATGS